MASSATEFLLELLEDGGDDAMDFWATVSEIAGATITAFSTEVPEWLKQAAAEQLQTVFQYDYWLAVGDTTREAVRATIERGINDGLSIREVADLIQEERGPDYAHYRAMATARTETNNCLNRGSSVAIQTLEDETGLEMQKEWMGALSTTSRLNHTAMDGQVSRGPDKLFAFLAQDGETYNIPEPGDPSLPAADRCNCGCGILSSFVGEEVDRSDLDAVREELLSTDAPTLLDMEASHKPHGAKYSPDQPRDEQGRFGEGGGGATGDGEGGSDVPPSQDDGDANTTGSLNVKLSKQAEDWIEAWSYSKNDDIATLTDDLITEFSATVSPDAEPLLLYRAAPFSDVARPPKEGLRSWTTNKSVAEGLLETSEGDEKRVLLTYRAKPERILVNTDNIDSKFMEEIGHQHEVIVAYGKMQKRIAAVRSKKKSSTEEE